LWKILGNQINKEKTMIRCKVEDCRQPAEAKGFCPLHYGRYRIGIIDLEGQVLRELKRNPAGECKVDGCGTKRRSKGFCLLHYGRFRLGAIDIEGREVRPLKRIHRDRCTIDGCNRQHLAKGLCSRHYSQSRRNKLNPSPIAKVPESIPKIQPIQASEPIISKEPIQRAVAFLME
jgi:hypothetical protein